MHKALDRITLADLLQSEGRLTDLLRARLAEAVLEPANPLFPVISVTTTADERETTSQRMS
jgi:hypothetical protein